MQQTNHTMNASDRDVFEYRLDFLYQSIAVYAGTMVVYLLVRRSFAIMEFPTVLEDPIAALLSGIILISLVGLVYNLAMRKRMEIAGDEVRFRSALREKVIPLSDVVSVTFSRERGKINRGTRIIRVRLKTRRRALRIHPLKFTRSQELTARMRSWAGPLAIERVPRRVKRRTRRTPR